MHNLDTILKILTFNTSGNEVIKINPNNDEAYFSRGSSYYLSGRRNQGVEDFQKAASLGNENARKILKKI